MAAAGAWGRTRERDEEGEDVRGGGVRGEWAGDRSRRGTPWHRVWKRDADRVEGG